MVEPSIQWWGRKCQKQEYSVWQVSDDKMAGTKWMEDIQVSTDAYISRVNKVTNLPFFA